MGQHRQQSLVWLVIVALGLAALAIALWQFRDVAQLASAINIPWPALIVGFVAAEVFVVFLHFRSESVAFAFTEIPLVLGALFAPPLQVWAAMTIGAFVAFTFAKKQDAIKVAFNTANMSMQGALTLCLMHWLINDPFAPLGWIVAVGASLSAGLVALVAFVVVVSIVENRFNIEGVKQTAVVNSATSVSNVGLALVAGSLIDYRPVTVLLLLAPLVMLYVAYRSFLSEREQRERVQFMYDSTSEISAMRDQAAIPAMLASTADRLRANRADLFLLPASGDSSIVTWFPSSPDSKTARELTPEETAIALRIAHSTADTKLMGPDELNLLTQLVGAPVRTAMIGDLDVEDRTLGFICCADRLGQVNRDFTHADVTLFSTVVDQLTLALENNQLGQTVSALKQVEQELSAQAHHDALTGLANRTKLSNVFASAVQENLPVSVLYIDLDDFKLINDGLGHQAGDEVLVETGRRIGQVIGPNDCVARLGGDEFAVMLVNAPDDMAMAKQLLRLINEPIQVAGHEAQVGVSIGVTRARPGQDLETVIGRADTAMYSAKGSGKGAVALDKPSAPTGFRATTGTKPAD